ncbi:MAG: hypothetical protein WA126_00690 [Thermodesulfovibrionales bacterium]
MKKIALYIIILYIFLMAFGCGGGGGSGSAGFSTVTISATYKNISAGRVRAATVVPVNIRYTVTGLNMEVMTGVFPVTGDFVDIEIKVPTGPQRHFLIEALSGSGGVIYRGEAFQDLDGTPTNIVIELEEVLPHRLVGTWAHVALERTNNGIWGSLLETVVFRNDGTGSEINRRYNFGGDVASIDRIDFTYAKTENKDGSITLTMIYSDRTETHRIVLSDNGNMAIIDRTSNALVERIDVAIRMDTSKTYTDKDLSGDYYGTGYAYDKDLKYSNPGFYSSGSSINSYDGNGEFSVLRTVNGDGVILTDSAVGPYSVSTDGSYTFTYGNFNGYIGLSGLYVNSHPTVNNHWRFGFGMQREDRAYTTTDLGGTWVLTGFGEGNEGSSFGSAFGKMTCDGVGNCNAFLKNRKDGEIINEAVDFRDIFVEQDGSFGYFPDSISPNYAAAIGNDGNTILLNMSFGQSTLYDREILIGVRCSNCTNIMGQGGKIQARRAFNFKKRLGVVSHK